MASEQADNREQPNIKDFDTRITDCLYTTITKQFFVLLVPELFLVHCESIISYIYNSLTTIDAKYLTYLLNKNVPNLQEYR